jgi:very-short-patch-repair endonuclease
VREGEHKSRAFAKQLRKQMPRSEALLWSYIRKRAINGARFRRQHPIGPYVADFACVAARLIVEVDGATHSTPEELAHDARRTKYLETQGWTVIRVTNTDIYENMDGVWRTIAAQLAPPPRYARDLPAGGED